MGVNSVRSATALAAIAIATLIQPGVSYAQSKYPHQTVTMVTHSSPGGGSDVFIRELVKHLGPEMGVNFVVENRSGGSGAKAMAKMAQSPGDGSTFYVSTPTYIQTTLLSKVEFGYDSLDPIVTIFQDPTVVYTRVQSPFKTLADAVNHAKKDPGKGKWGASNPTALERIALEKLNRLTGARAAVVSHEGGGDMMLNVLNGSLDFGIGEVQEILPQLQAGRVKLLGVFSEKRLEQYPDLATAKEQGFNVAVNKFRGIAGPKNVPAPVVQAWEQAVQKVLAKPEYKKVYQAESLIPAYKNQKESREFVGEFVKEVSTSLRELGIIK
ncbi:MAG: tripartite tricarboxylate transporter substrate binding protein [Burkholderiales bacterium]|nr:tripartite tricarboxylate transporter substrate binding protein [Burkholderiales bacterium]